MRIPRSFTIEREFIDLVNAEDNASDLINQLLLEHYNKNDYNRMSKEELVILMKKEQARLEYEQKIKEIDAGLYNDENEETQENE